VHQEPLTEDELAEVRRIIEADKRRVWLMSSVRATASWIVVVLGGVALSWDSLVKAIKAATGSGE
jgi:hypothetical protein